VTRKRLYLETMEQVIGGSQKVIVDKGASGNGVLPYLPLPALRSAPPTASPPSITTGSTPTQVDTADPAASNSVAK
jgi:membrane protease subunit HflK